MSLNGHPHLIPQPGGKGALLSGGIFGHRGGGGRPPSVVREIARESFAERIPRLTAIIDDPTSQPRDVIAAMALLERTGLGMRHEVDAAVGIGGRWVSDAEIKGATEKLRAKIEALVAARLPKPID